MKQHPFTSAGSAQLRAVLAPRMTQTALARELGVTQQAVSSWLTGRARPDVARMRALEELLGVPMRAWVEPPEAAPEAAA